MDIKVKKKNVHSKILFKKVEEHVKATITLLDLASDLDTVVSLIEMLLYEEADQHKLEQINVIGDGRNNKLPHIKRGIFKIDVSYKHLNCFNTTILNYTIDMEI